MQQVAAQKTDIAALPFSASSTAKAVGTSIGTQQEVSSVNNQAFNRLYEEAKSSKSDFVLNDKETLSSQSRAANCSNDTHASSPASNNTMKSDKDRDAGHTDLPVEKNETDIPSDSAADTKEKSVEIGSKEIAEDRESAKTQQTTDEEGDVNLAVDDAQGNTAQKTVTEAQFVIGAGGKKDAEAGVITTPGTPDGKPGNENEEPDWIAYVETVANRFGKNEQSSDASNPKANNDISAVVDEAVNVLSVKESGKLWKLPDDVNASDAPSIMAHLLSQLNNGSSEGDITLESISSEAQQMLSALTSLLLGADAKGGQGGGNEDANNALIHASANAKSDMNSDDDKGLTALIAQLMQQKESAGDGVQDSSGEAEGASKLDRVLTGGKNSADESLVLSLLSDELKSMQELSLDEASSEAKAEASLAELTAATVSVKTEEVSAKVTNANNATSSDVGLKTNSSSDQGQSANDELVGAVPKDLLTAISELSPQSAQKAAETFAERVVAGMPSGSQQQSVKANIIAGINEFQQQVQQGREPGIDLSAIIADAAKEAAVSNDVIASMTARVDGQATQFLNLMNQTQASAQQAFASMLGQTDTVMHENNQLRAEASKSQQQFEGFDKAVNIHKPEGQQQLNEKIRWMVNARNTMAEIRLDPPELGSMQVRVNVSGDAASVSFIVQSQQAKEALSEAMPKLRDMLSEQGIELGDAQVRKDNSSGNENGQQLAGNGNEGRGDGNRNGNDELDEMENGRVIEQSVTRAAKGGIDFYA
ncbi:flagellar hook-length control protein FliK [Alteromonas marina]|uniref:flagellar hook-length control protein FliK n=1 Tax=Alteromonas sp. KUL150 TaxID=2480805 RepID=UPI0012E6317E|nr:flagellar hook-length control protein FliK [Alteromonas sp. KUL150]GFD72817.1 flagellar hook-length control protein FliK [Tenacibaculum sp. KUL113]GFD86308.1 flagellar hook-length control protein FliK [Alteromonas sp. KUL150]